MKELVKYKKELEVPIKDMLLDTVYVQGFSDFFLLKGKTATNKCFAAVIKISQKERLEEGIDTVKNSILTSNKIGYRRFLRLLNEQPGKLPDITRADQDTIKVIHV